MAYDSGVTEVQWLTQDELQVWQSYILCQYDLERVISADLSCSGLSHADYAVLVAPPVLPDLLVQALSC